MPKKSIKYIYIYIYIYLMCCQEILGAMLIGSVHCWEEVQEHHKVVKI